MPTLKECLALVLIALLSVLSVASPVKAFERQWGNAEAVTVTNKATNPVPVSVQGTPQVTIGNTTATAVPVTIVGGGTVGGVAVASSEDGAQFTRQNNPSERFVVLSAADLQRTGKRFVVDFLSAEVGLTPADCSLLQVRVEDTMQEFGRNVMVLHGSASGLWASSRAAKLLVDPGQRILAIAFPGCDATSFMLSVVGHYIDR